MCISEYRVDGRIEELRALYRAMQAVEQAADGHYRMWELYRRLIGEPPRGKDLRGDWSYLELNEAERFLEFSLSSAWTGLTDEWDELAGVFPSLRCYFRCDGGCEYYDVRPNRERGWYVDGRVLLDCCLPPERYFYETFADVDSALAFLSRETGRRLVSVDDVDSAFDDLYAAYPSFYVIISE